MALTASAQSALPLAWDETIVPALRKRLESESRILSKRMSTASISSFDEPPYPPPRGSSQTDTSTSTVRQYPTNGRGEGGMLQRPATAKQPNGHAQAASPTHHRTDTGGSTNSARRARARTYSQPLGYDGPMKKVQGQANGLPTPGSSRSTSPLQNYNNGRTSDVKPTRIPIVAARGRAPSVSSYATGRTSDVSSRNGNGNGVYGSPPIGPQPNLYDVEEASSNHSKSTVAVPSRQPSGILDEPAPFKGTSINSGASNPYSVEQNQPPPPSDPLGRKSTDSEERPFEHWYRGDVYRNGGVGELRVGGKQEMLDIANYGHRFGGVGSKPPPPPSTPSTSRGRSEQEDAFPVRRKRAESVGARESFYMDEDRAKELSNVLNEDPLTDLEGDGDQDITPSETDHDYYAANGFSGASYSTGDMRSTTPTANNDWSLERERNAPQTRIPEPRQISAPPQSYNSSSTAATTRGGSEPPTLPATSSTSAGVRSQQTARSVSNPPSPDTAKRRAKSPPASVSSKKPKKASKSPARTKMADDKDRRSVAVYPELQGDDMENAIPSWTQPKPAGGNWDEVVLPVVARKRGLDGQYESKDGSPEPRKPEPERIAPAPGTFGYDHSKYRPPRDQDNLPMNEFGQQNSRNPDMSIAEEDEEIGRGRGTSFANHDDTRPAYVRPHEQNQVPFSQYDTEHKVPEIRITRPTFDMEQEQAKEDEQHGGCCAKCVIM